ncbi:VTT domain-containing protein [Legionella micdadei]|uniref:DedA/PAP2 domain protein n=1 Tax=Legionella micdadei TaxID=451 RepID=A0A098GFR6_LEGMI|nr:VTT domain-containing protein [Legionella micdadei]ARG97600.1 hypothetical protein B6N58_07940 [Legionella micdadei]ARH00088.1 hypothetical protein B6V88_06485 [Legionella micdadei]KTD27682.1 secretion system protein Y [Legionella micdadei]CEG60832.1 DedA/PAP2 domain protein [Legionella micdadei]SCY14579.1 membrane protein DedA, SNARE-associated domain [Legionella micdadei]
MHLFTDYIQPLTIWLHNHPQWALLITFVVALSESLAIVGSIIPGSVTMTAIGILAGSGVMRIDSTLIAAALGAIAGDGASYLLGYYFSERLTSIWPFSRYPNWLSYGKEYFARHGGKSVVIGRFVGPLRSIIPVIAGMMHMNRWRFFIANFISAIGWSILYVLPGVLIGTASSELSPESATRLFMLILILLAGIWLLSVGLKWLFIRINNILRVNLHRFWSWAANSHSLGNLTRFLTPKDETDHYPTAALSLLFLLVTLSFFLLTVFVLQGSSITAANQPIQFLLQTLRTQPFDVLFTIIAQIGNPITLATLLLSFIVLALYYYDFRTLFYWLSLSIWCTAVLAFVHILGSANFSDTDNTSIYPVTNLSFATTLFVTFILYVNGYWQTRYRHLLTVILTSSLILIGFTSLYFGEYLFTDCLGAYLVGLSICLGHWLFYRRHKPQIANYPSLPLIIFFLLFLATLLSSLFNFNSWMRNHQPYFAQYVLTDELWWNQTKPLLPIYRTNRIGRRISLFNIQFAGSIDDFEQALTSYGWQKQNDSFFNSIITRVSGQSSPELTLMAQLYLNRKPVLVMTFEPTDGNPVQVLRIWRSNYHLQHFRQPIWIGSVQARALSKKNPITNTIANTNRTKSITYVSSALLSFELRTVAFPARVSKQTLPVEVEPILLLVRQPPNGDSGFILPD